MTNSGARNFSRPEAVAEEQTQLEQLVVVLVQQQLETVELENQIQFLDQT